MSRERPDTEGPRYKVEKTVKSHESRSKQLRDDALRRSTRRRSEEAVDKAERAITQLLVEGEKLTFTSVARVGGVSKKFLHQNKQLADRIRLIGSQQKMTGYSQEELSTSSNESLVTTLQQELKRTQQRHKKQIEQLKKENKKLGEELRTLYEQQKELEKYIAEIGSFS